jgi:GT2 family glycosyltransferase
VVVHWGERAVTEQCLRSLASLSGDWFLVLVDNGCNAFSTEGVAEWTPRATYLRSAENLGYAGGCNLGMREALRRGAEYVWFLNNDAQPDPGAIDELLFVVRGAVAPAIVGAKILRLDDPRRLDSIALRVDLDYGRIYLIGHDEIDAGQYDDWKETEAVTGCAMLVTRQACQELGGFEEDFFAYLEDADLCLRARQRGWRVAVAPRARVYHDRPTATGRRQSITSLYYTARNHLMLMQRHGRGRWWQAAAVVLLNLAYALRVGGGTDLAPLRAVVQGIRDYRRGLSGPRPAPISSQPKNDGRPKT